MRKLSLLLMICLIGVLGCQKENLNEQEDSSIHTDVHNTLFKKGKLNDYGELKTFVDNIKTKGKNELSRTAFETDNDFTILEEQDISVHTGNEFNTYTIPVIKAEQPIGTFTNLVVQFKVEVDSTSAYLLTYLPTDEYLQASALDSRAAFTGGVSYEPLNYDGSLDGMNARRVCQSFSFTYCNYGGSTHNAGNCTASNMWTETFDICYESDGYGPVYNSIDEPGGPSGGGGGGNDDYHNPYSGSSTTPTNPFAFYQNSVRDALGLNDFADADADAIDWIEDVNNAVDVLNIYFYLKSNLDASGNYDQNDLDFVEAAIEAIIEDDDLDEAMMIEDDDLEFESLVTIYNEMDKECQAIVLFRSLTKVNSNFTNMIKDNYIKSSDNDIIMHDFDVGDVNSILVAGAGAGTDPNPDTNADTNADIINIQFNNTYLSQATNLGYVATFYHELLHAHIYHLYHDGTLLTEYPNYTVLKTALDNWFANPDDTTIEDIASQEMHNIYVDFIDDLADSLVEYCIVNNISGVDTDYAKKLVWGGLNGYDVFDDNLTQAERDEAQEKLAYENFNHTQHAKSQKTCN